MNKSINPWLFLLLLALALIQPGGADAVTFKRIVVFGTSLSDPGNAFALTSQAISPPYTELDDFLIPPAPYKRGGHHFSNGATWIEQLGRRIGRGEDVGAAFEDSDNEAWNYAVGGARARSDGVSLNFPEQVAAFLADVDYSAPSHALYVIDMGANDVRDALVAGSPVESQTILGDALAAIGAQMGTLYGAGARKFLVLNVPDLGVVPSIKTLDSVFPGAAAFAGLLAQLFNANLDAVVASVAALPSVEIARMDVHRKVNEIIASPAAFGFAEVTAPCITPDIPPFTCRKPERYLFWDGIHPTKAGHEIFAREAAEVLGVRTRHAPHQIHDSEDTANLSRAGR